MDPIPVDTRKKVSICIGYFYCITTFLLTVT